MQERPTIIGVDVAKAELVMSAFGQQSTQCIPNSAESIEAWLDGLPAGSLIAMESTGAYHQVLARRAHQRGMVVYVLNARDVYFYSQGLGSRAKTDRVDAKVIARYVAEHHRQLHPWQPGSSERTEVEELLRRRALLVAKRDAVRQTLRGCASMKDELAALIGAFDATLKALDGRVQQLIAADEQLAKSQQRIQTVVGFGPQASALLAVLLSRIAFRSADALVAYSGMDLRANDSGRKRGKRVLSKRGAPSLRRQWYLSGLSASRSKACKPIYEALRARGLSSTEVFLILGRKLLRIAYAVWKTGRPFDPGRLAPKTA
jgi:transposase